MFQMCICQSPSAPRNSLIAVLREPRGLKFAQTLDLAMIGRGLPALLLNQLQSLARAHSAVDEYGAGEQHAAAYAVFAVDQDAPILLDALGSPARTVHQLIYGQWKSIPGWQVQKLNMFPGHRFGIIAMFRTRINHMRHTCSRQRCYVTRMNAP